MNMSTPALAMIAGGIVGLILGNVPVAKIYRMACPFIGGLADAVNEARLASSRCIKPDKPMFQDVDEIMIRYNEKLNAILEEYIPNSINSP
jgi:hypothetical protein